MVELVSSPDHFFPFLFGDGLFSVFRRHQTKTEKSGLGIRLGRAVEP